MVFQEITLDDNNTMIQQFRLIVINQLYKVILWADSISLQDRITHGHGQKHEDVDYDKISKSAAI